MQKYGHLANEHVANEFHCEVCGERAGFNWSDRHGEGMCNSCGVPYDLLVTPYKINVRDEWLPAVKACWAETKAYMGLGSIFIWHDYPEAAEGRAAFYKWCDAHPDLVPKPEPESECVAKLKQGEGR